ncbi:hypothetical protein SAMN05216559_2299 [Halomicrobium zhouii]|uniref:Uncharacterized protein n=1 Tax=Halomicrobium zhouii TaxID=767519 RepID=A0A1I6L9E1_9EURY|nr:hypothetical protein [Halomicrobium zhouii]SFS00034.1 hypothetical protein SAMN05216559_2299 [Halomicrobium zhouii]
MINELSTLISIVSSWLQEWGQIGSGFASVLLSGTLAFLYYKQHGVLKKQMEKETETDIISEGIGISESELRHKTSYDNQIYFRFSNIGQGRTNEMAIRVIPELLSEVEVDLESVQEELERIQIAALEEAGTEIKRSGNYLEGGERDVKFAIPAHTGGFFIQNEFITRGGHLSLSELPEPVSEVKLQSRITKNNYPDLETEEETEYHLSLDGEDRVSSILYDKPDVSDLPVDSEEKIREKVSKDAKKKIVDNAVGTLFVRIKYILEYKDGEGEVQEKQLLDMVFPSRYGVSDEILFSSGIEFERFQLQGDKQSMIERSMFSKIGKPDSPHT